MRRIYIEITDLCGLNCHFCPPHKQSAEPMTLALFESAAAQAARFVREVALYVLGDPLMVENLTEYLDICDRRSLRVALTTVGLELVKGDRHALLERTLLHSAIKQINFSVSGFLANKTAVSLEEYLRTLFGFVQSARLARSAAFINFRLWNGENAGNAAVIERLRELFGAGDRGENPYIQLAPKTRIVFDRQFEWAVLGNPALAANGRCLGAKEQLAILKDGRVTACCIDHAGALSFGSITTHTIEELLHTDRAKRLIAGFRAHKLVEPLCQTCGFRTRFDR
ncbi:radical SAM protein [Campylobacterota bacterium]|nr:radical SAM protein [Campylobacterota bacterium]